MSDKFVAYNASKSALNMQTAVLANRWAASCTCCPASVAA